MALPTTGASLFPNYEFQELRSIREVKEIFGPNGENADHLNWLFCGIATPHSLDTSLNEAEKILDDEHEDWKPSKSGRVSVPVMVLHPRLCVIKYGDIQVNRSDIEYLRMIINKTIENILESQGRNV